VVDIVDFRGKKLPEGMRPAKEGDTGNPEILQAFAEFKKMVEEGKVEGMVIVATSKDGETLATVAGLISPTQMTGLLETVKLQLLLG
jgi:hypothetical protein